MIIGKPTSTPPHPGNRGKDLIEVFLRTLESEVTDDKRTGPRMEGGDDRPSVDLLRGQPLSRMRGVDKIGRLVPEGHDDIRHAGRDLGVQCGPEQTPVTAQIDARSSAAVCRPPQRHPCRTSCSRSDRHRHPPPAAVQS